MTEPQVSRTRPQRPSRGARLSPSTETAPEARRPFWREHGPIVLIAVLAAAVRLVGLSNRILIYDESLLFDPGWLQRGLSTYAHDVWNNTTYNPGWAVVVWVMHRFCGLSLFAARLPSCAAGVMAPVAVYAAARAMGMRRPAALWAGLIMALSLFQIEYGQQILPYALMPLGAGVCVWLVTMLARPETAENPRALAAYAAGFIAAFGVLVFVHNSTLLLAPPLFLFWAWNVLRPEGGLAVGPRRLSAITWALCALATGLSSLGWFFAKSGEADRGYLHPYFPGTFRTATDLHFVSEMIKSADTWYAGHRPGLTGADGKLLDLSFFTASRVFDFAFGHFRTCPEQQYSKSWVPWLIPLPMLAVLAFGAWRSLRGESGPLVRRWVACSLVMLGLCLLLSGLRVFPLGGIRQLIALSPLVVLTAASAFEARASLVARVVLASGLVWAAGTAAYLPKYYRTTADSLGPHRLRELAERHGVKHVVSGDTLCSIGALRLNNARGLRGDVLSSDDPGFAALVKRHEPFLLVSLFDPILTKTGDAVETSGLYKFLAHPLATLDQYTATPLIRPKHRIAWLDWSVYLLRPKPGPHGPEVEEVSPCTAPGQPAPWAFTVRFTRPMRAEDFVPGRVRLTPQSPSGGWDEPQVPLNVSYQAETRTLLVTPRQPLRPHNYVLAIDRTVGDLDGRKLVAPDPKTFYHVYWGSPAGH